MRGFAILSGSICGLSLILSAPLHAGTASDTLEVSLRVLPGCSVTAAALAFTAQAGSAAEAEAPINVRCTADTGIEVSLDKGRHAAGAQRRLTSETGATVAYEIYLDRARTNAWPATAIVGKAGPDGALQLVAYGRVEPRDSAVPAGDYRDSVTVTVAF
jgi:spore coat protein U-like protein